MRMVPDWSTYLAWRDQFAAVIDVRYFPLEWLEDRLLSGLARLFHCRRAAIIAEVREYPGGGRDVHGLIAAGDKDEIVELLIPQAEAWGLENGCIAAVVESRPGWARALKPSGYEISQVAVRKELTRGHQ